MKMNTCITFYRTIHQKTTKRHLNGRDERTARMYAQGQGAADMTKSTFLTGFFSVQSFSLVLIACS